MDLQTAVAASMLPASKARIAAAFHDLQYEPLSGPAFLELLWSACGRSGPLPSTSAGSFLETAERGLESARRLGIEALAAFDGRYPALLACIPDPPPVLWVRGKADVLTRPTVAVIGSRAATPYALEVGTRIAAELAQRGVVVASGLARGVDSAAHRGCLGAGGTTVAVQGCGLDRVYPPEHDELAERITRNGLVVSELAPGAAPLPEHFSLRNRIISGISLATVVVEASERSGSLITARYALEQGRDVMAVPGSVLSGRNRGSHALLKDGARVVETADDILQGLGWGVRVEPPEDRNPAKIDPLLSQMTPGESYGLEALAALTGLTGSELLVRITELEIAGRIAVSTGVFTRLS
jgi:DNA processing protein